MLFKGYMRCVVFVCVLYSMCCIQCAVFNVLYSMSAFND